jgi:hypothetical protein
MDIWDVLFLVFNPLIFLLFGFNLKYVFLIFKKNNCLWFVKNVEATILKKLLVCTFCYFFSYGLIFTFVNFVTHFCLGVCGVACL